MMDQAQKLRNLVNSRREKKDNKGIIQKDKDKGSAHIYTITSGKGGVGKSNFTANLALALQELGEKVIVIDADLGMANLDVILGVSPQYNLSHVINGEKKVYEIIVKGPQGLPLVPGGSGMQDLADLSRYQLDNLIRSWKEIATDFDIILIDTGAGLSKNVIKFVLAADEVIIISTPEPTSITDAYGVIKVIRNYNQNIKVKLMVNQAKNDQHGTRIGEKLINTTRDFLELEIELLGVLPKDQAVEKAVIKRTPFFIEFPRARVVKAINNIATELTDKEMKESKGVKGFFQSLLGFGK